MKVKRVLIKKYNNQIFEVSIDPQSLKELNSIARIVIMGYRRIYKDISSHKSKIKKLIIEINE